MLGKKEAPKIIWLSICSFLLICLAWTPALSGAATKNQSINKTSEYEIWQTLGRAAGEKALSMLESESDSQLIVLTSAGSSIISGFDTLGCLDGLSKSTGSTMGRATLLPVTTRFDAPLWFAFFHRSTGQTAYFELNPKQLFMDETGQFMKPEKSLFTNDQLVGLMAEELFEKARQGELPDMQAMSGNLFRITTLANALHKGLPGRMAKALSLHDHYCPGLTSGVLFAEYMRLHHHLDPSQEIFVLTTQPWCKEDALINLLAATPGKKAYATIYPDRQDEEQMSETEKRISTIVFTTNPHGLWRGAALEFLWGHNQAVESFDSPLLDRLAAVLWYLDHLDEPERFVNLVQWIELPQGSHPRDWMRPGKNPLQLIQQ
ncbi:FmdE family protein [Desulfonatronovibrio hydrogenovorans]|uniref:FmdE family protein n=1 Tax=Desulfonatronovibrio hydrogenovorans TaxID=53245 RepID=UPI00048B00EA|nr:FmdE family protein [Desulfonatronovibrio hydrogenovorans]